MLIACVFLFSYFSFVYAAIEIFSMNKVEYNLARQRPALKCDKLDRRRSIKLTAPATVDS